MLTVKSIAEELAVSQDKVRAWCESGAIEAINAGDGENKHWRITEAAFEEFKITRSNGHAERARKRKILTGKRKIAAVNRMAGV